MQPGAIFLHKQYAFQDGGIADKYFVVLGEDSGILVAAKTTSKGDRYRNEHGCQSGNYFAAFMLTKGCCALPLNTWICLSEFYEFSMRDLQSKLIAGTVFSHSALKPELTLDVQFCAIGCDDISSTQEGAVRNYIERLKLEIAAQTASAISAQTDDAPTQAAVEQAPISALHPTAPSVSDSATGA